MPNNKIDGGLYVETTARGRAFLIRALHGAGGVSESIRLPIEVLPDLIAELERLQREGMGGS